MTNPEENKNYFLKPKRSIQQDLMHFKISEEKEDVR